MLLPIFGLLLVRAQGGSYLWTLRAKPQMVLIFGVVLNVGHMAHTLLSLCHHSVMK